MQAKRKDRPEKNGEGIKRWKSQEEEEEEEKT